MTTSYTANVNLLEPSNGSDVGSWDSPVNGNMVLIDLIVGGIATVGLNNTGVVLNSGQYQCRQITFNSTLAGNVAITFPSTFTKAYEIQNLCTGSSAYTITLETTVSGGQVICCPPGETIDVFNDGTNLKYKNLGRVGQYWDYAGSSVPLWVSGCTVPPYLNCDGTTFSSATYPILSLVLGGTTLPNSQGKYRLTLNQSASTPISSANGATFNASAVGNVGGVQATMLTSIYLPQSSDPGHVHGIAYTLINNGTIVGGISAGGGSYEAFGSASNSPNTNSAKTGITYGSSSQITLPQLPPTYVGGLTLIRAG
jgi:hypothetical protein